MGLKGMVAVVTGASSGIGQAVMHALAREGAHVAALARDMDKLTSLIEELDPAYKGNVIGIRADVRDEASVQNAIQQAMSTFGKIDILLNAAGVSMRGKQLIREIDLAEWNRIMETNLTGTFLMCREVLPRMEENNTGYIINILSTAAFSASGGDSAYAASKFGARALTEALKSGSQGTGIRVTSISPGAVNTNIWSHKAKPVSQERRDAMLKAEEIADIVLFLVTRPPGVHIENITVTPWNADDSSGSAGGKGNKGGKGTK